MIRKAVALLAGAALLVAPGASFGQAAGPETFKGMIVSHKDSRIVVRTPAGDRQVNLTAGTRIEGTQGAGILRREDRQASDLIRGLAIEVTGVSAGQEVSADAITFKTSDLKTAQQIQAGLAETEETVAQQEARLNNIGNLVAAGRAKVYFEVGSAALTDEGKSELQAIAAKAKAIPSGYRLAVVGRADPTGDAAANKRLSARRAAAVKTYLLENAGVLPGQFVPSTALGESSIVDDPDPPKNASEARRVTVTIMVSKASTPG